MIKQLKFNSKLNNIFFYSDIHDSHAKDFILNPRGFKNADEGREIIIDRWNDKVTNNDIVFLLGDCVVGAGDHSLERFENLLTVLNYKEIYIQMGNHFAGFRTFFDKAFYEPAAKIDYYYRLTVNYLGRSVHLIPNYYEIIIDNTFINLSHYPLASFNHCSKGAIHIHGHCHNNLKNSELGKLLYKGKVLDCGVESVESPISFKEVLDILDKRDIVSFDHH